MAHCVHIAGTVQPTLVRRQRGFTLLELMVVVCIIMIIAAMVVPQTIGFTHAYRVRNDANSIQGLLMIARMRASQDFARTQVICYTTTTPNYCELQVAQFTTANPTAFTTASFVPDSLVQRVYLSAGVSFAVPSVTYGVQGQSAIAPVQGATWGSSSVETAPYYVWYSSRGWPLGPDSVTLGFNGYALYLLDAPKNEYAAIGVDASGRAYVYGLSGSTWTANQ